jgi:hypothetical protein
MKSHSGTIGIYKTTSLGLRGSIYNSDTFKITNGAGTTTLCDEFTFNTGSLTKIYIYIYLSNLLVTDTYGNIVSMNNTSQYFNQSSYS